MRALITGITGQDGSYLAELLLEKGYEVHGIIRRSSSFNTGRIDYIFNDLHLHYGDLTDYNSLLSALYKAKPDEVYNLGAQSHVRTSFDVPIYTSQATGLGTLNMLEATLTYGDAKFYQASSSELFGSAPAPQSETTPFHPRSPYGIAKQFAYWSTVNYREAYNMFACNGILFNHESPRRGDTFVTQKIVKAAVRIYRGQQKELVLGNLDAKRDWGFAGDYVKAMWLMLQQEKSDDYVIATGETHSVREFLDTAFKCVNLDWHDYVKIDLKYYRPAEVDILLGDATKARIKLGWQPQIRFEELVRGMMTEELLK
jgi:GDPmannose 4,6-dehydratase